MGRRRLLLLLKPLDAYSFHPSNAASYSSRSINPKALQFLDSRHRVHKNAIEFCRSILQRNSIDWDATFCNNLSRPFKMWILLLLLAVMAHFCRQVTFWMIQSHFVIIYHGPFCRVNSDPTQPQEVQELSNEFDATRSTGYLCAILNNILEGQTTASELSRMSIHVNSMPLSTYALNDILIADPCPASASRFSFRIRKDGESSSPLVNYRSSGLRISTASTGSTAAMLPVGGFPMPILSKDLQYMVREPSSPEPAHLRLMPGLIKPKETMDVDWYRKEGLICIDGSSPIHPVQHGDNINVTSHGPVLKIF